MATREEEVEEAERETGADGAGVEGRGEVGERMVGREDVMVVVTMEEEVRGVGVGGKVMRVRVVKQQVVEVVEEGGEGGGGEWGRGEGGRGRGGGGCRRGGCVKTGKEEEGVNLEGLDDLGQEEDEEGVLDDLEEDEEKVTEGEEEKEKEGEEEKEKEEEEEEEEEEVAEAEGFESGGIPKEKGQVWLERVMVKVKVRRRQVILSSGGWWPQPLDPSLAPEQKAQCQIPFQCACKHWSRISAWQDAGRPHLCRWASCGLQVGGGLRCRLRLHVINLDPRSCLWCCCWLECCSLRCWLGGPCCRWCWSSLVNLLKPGRTSTVPGVVFLVSVGAFGLSLLPILMFVNAY